MAKRKTAKRKPINPKPPESNCTAVAEASPDGRGALGGVGTDLPIEAIDPSPWQPRREFDAAELHSLGETLLEQGLLQPIAVRPAGERYELIAGERRLRAAQLIGWTHIPAVVRAVDDQRAAELTALENLQREDLNAIEEAEAYRALLAADPELTQAELGRRLGKSQPHIANRLRLLRLPEAARTLLISGEIPPTWGRELLAYPEHPAIDAALANGLAVYARCPGSLEEFRQELENAVDSETGQIDGERWVSELGRRIPMPEWTDEELAELDIVEIGPEQERRACNMGAWRRMFARRIDAAKNDKSKGKSKAKSPAGKTEPAKPPTAAQKKAAAAEERRKRADRQRQFARRLWEWYANWHRWLLAEWIRAEAVETDLLRLLLALASQWHCGGYQVDRRNLLADVIRSIGVKTPGHSLAPAIASLEQDHALEAAAGLLARLLWDKDQPVEHIVPKADAVAWCRSVGIDAEAAWLEDQAGPLSEAYWNRHTKDQLVALGKELKVDLEPGWSKASMTAAFLRRRPKPDDVEVGIDLPKELKNLTRPK